MLRIVAICRKASSYHPVMFIAILRDRQFLSQRGVELCGDDPVQSIAVHPQYHHADRRCSADQRDAHAERKHVTVRHQVAAPRFQVVLDAEDLEVGGE